jgi:hypothetical protein
MKNRIALLLQLAFVALSSLGLNAKALMNALEIELPSVQGWRIEAVARSGSVMCAARQAEKNGEKMTLLADTGKYRGGVWFLDVTTRNQHLKAGIKKAPAYLFLDGKPVVTGEVLDIGDWRGNKRTATYVRFEFPAIDAYIENIKAARVVKVQADGLIPIKLESLLPIITAIENCQRDSLHPEFWKGAEAVCN